MAGIFPRRWSLFGDQFLTGVLIFNIFLTTYSLLYSDYSVLQGRHYRESIVISVLCLIVLLSSSLFYRGSSFIYHN